MFILAYRTLPHRNLKKIKGKCSKEFYKRLYNLPYLQDKDCMKVAIEEALVHKEKTVRST